MKSDDNYIMNAKYIFKTVMRGAAAGALLVLLQNRTAQAKTRVIQKLKEILWRFS
jgi:hypothetical protein